MRRNYLYIIICLLFQHLALGQRGVEIFADTLNNDSLQKLVTIFTEQLKRSTGGNYKILPVSSYKGKGIYLNSSRSSDQLVKPSSKLLSAGVEAFSLDGDKQTVRIIGNCNMAIGHGLFSYLELIGYRYYFANPDWHVIPDKPVLFRKWHVVSAPSFYHRRIWYGYGTGSKIADADYDFWFLANKQGGSLNAMFGHSYDEIISRNKEMFLKHPDWLYPPLKNGNFPAEGAKFDMSKEDLVQFIIQDVEKRIETSLKNKTNDYKMITLGPSDGPGTCNSPACQQLGTMTDRVYYLTNRVAKAIQKKYPTTMIGCMAYGEYTPPPTKKVEPNVFVAITTAFSSSKYSVEQLVGEWAKKGPMVGIYDYFSWYAWDFDVPGQSIVSQYSKVKKNIKKYYDKGVRAYDAESSIGWVNKGLGYYLASKLMWDINFDPQPAIKEFFRLCFGKAAGVMEKLWSDWDNYSFTTVREGDLARWIDYTIEAERLEKDEKVKKRLFQVKCYLHWLFLYRNYQFAKNEPNLAPLLNFGYRKLDDGSISGYPAFFVLGNGSGIPTMAWDKGTYKHNGRPITPEDINQMIRDDRSRLKVPEPVKNFAAASKFKNVANLERYQKMFPDSNTYAGTYWYTNEWVMEIKTKGNNNYLEMRGDLIADPANVKPIKISVYPFTKDGDVTGKKPLVYYEYTATKIKQKISLANLNPGYYTMIIEDPVKQFEVSFSPPINFSMVMRNWRQLSTGSIFYGFIYVPEGTKKFNVIKTVNLGFVTPTGRKVNFTDNKAEDVQVEVLKGEEGLWEVKPVYGKLMVEGIPPYLSVSAARMLIPADVK